MTKSYAVGDKFIGRWGAMFPQEEGEAIEVNENNQYLIIQWEDGKKQKYGFGDISYIGENRAVRPIGVYPYNNFYNL